uniref:Integrase catalytic domain-containing protein n=1 Tax=Caenorhabditis tropicalis TaxID=1561998 RepID=A0A1I7US55_9PELO
MPSQPLVVTPVEEAFQDMTIKCNSAKDVKKTLEKMFRKYSNRAEINNKEFENIKLNKYYVLTLRLDPEYVGFRWISNLSRPFLNEIWINKLCKTYICPVSYTKKGIVGTENGPIETSMGEIEELYIKLWIQRSNDKFRLAKREIGTKRLDCDRVVRDYYETLEITNRCLKEDSFVKYQILDVFYHKLNAIEIFLLNEICEAQTDPAITRGSHEIRQDVYKYITFLIVALLMYRETRELVAEHRETGRNGLMGLGDDEDGNVFAFPFLENTVFTGRPTLTTSATPSCSNQKVENVQTFHS